MTETDFYDIFQGQIAAFLLVLARTSGIFLISPFFGGMNVSVRIRATIAIVMAWVIFPVIVEKTTVTAPESILMFSGTVIQELFIGWLIGFIAYVAFAAINMAGKIMDMQVGFSVAQVMDPTSGQQSPLIGSFLYNLAIIYFLVVNGHHILIAALFESFSRIPLDGLVWNAALADFIVNITAGAMPVTFSVLIVNVGMGILARTMPQMNIFVVGIPLHLTIGSFMLMMLLPFFILFLDAMFDTIYADIITALKLISP